MKMLCTDSKSFFFNDTSYHPVVLSTYSHYKSDMKLMNYRKSALTTCPLRGVPIDTRTSVHYQLF